MTTYTKQVFTNQIDSFLPHVTRHGQHFSGIKSEFTVKQQIHISNNLYKTFWRSFKVLIHIKSFEKETWIVL